MTRRKAPADPPEILPPVAIILAAGRGARMGQPKALLPFGPTTALGHIVETARIAGAEPLVVTGAGRLEIEAECRRLETPAVHNAHWADGQTTSVQAGWAQAGPRDVLIWPVDAPLVEAATLRTLAATPAAAAVPVHGGYRGHPVFLTAGLRPDVMELKPDEPLHTLVRCFAVETSVPDHHVLDDVDTPEAYQALLKGLEERPRHA